MSYTDVKTFTRDLLLTYKAVIDIIRFSGNANIVNKKRQDAYKRAITTVEELYDSGNTSMDIKQYVKELGTSLTEKPCKVMKDLYKSGKVVLEDKEPYNGACICKGKIVKNSDGETEDLQAFQNLNALTGIGIGIGDAAIKELAEMGYTSIEELKTVYDNDKFKNFRKGIQGPLCKYFEGTVRIQKMSREEATKWKTTIDGLISSIETEDICYSIAGSYARKKELIGDIDYVIVIDSDAELYRVLNELLDKITEITQVEDLEVSLDSVVETPSKPTKERYTTGIKAWFIMPNGQKTKVEVYGYSMKIDHFCFAYFARAADVNLQKKIKYHASRKGYKLSPFGLFDKETDENIDSDIKNIRELYKFLEYKHGKL